MGGRDRGEEDSRCIESSDLIDVVVNAVVVVSLTISMSFTLNCYGL